VGAQFRRQDMRSDVFEQAPLGDDVANVRDVMESDGSGRENCRGHARQGRVLGAADRDSALNGVTTPNAKFFHARRLKEKLKKGEC
jgi:hypothetical protein